MTTDLKMLRALLDAGKSSLSGSEERSFRGMLQDLERGEIVRLSKNQRLWVESRYNALNLDRAYINKAPPKVKVVVRPSEGVPVWEQPKVMRPPGK